MTRTRFLIVLVGSLVAVYAGIWDAPFVFDDEAAVLDNPTIRTLWPLSTPLRPPEGGLPVSGRPVVNLSLAVNYAISGLHPWSYHATNVLLHGLAALVLLGVLRRTLESPSIPTTIRTAAPELASGVALLWALHPLATAAVTYTAQRTEVIASLSVLASLYAFIRSADPGAHRHGWWTVSIAACLLGMASKEITAAAPVLILLYDRTFVAGSWGAALRKRWPLYAGLGATWGVLAWLVIHSGTRGGTAGFGAGITPGEYLQTQAEALARYVGLALWPHPLVFDHGEPLTRDPRVWLPLGLALLALVALVAVGIARRSALAVPAAAAFALLAPTSSFVPVATQTIAEHRMYLPLAGVLTLLALALHACLRRLTLPVLLAAAFAAAIATATRNQDYSSAERLWRDTADKRPDNARAHNNLATLLFARGDHEGGMAAVQRALTLRPDYADAHRNLATALLLSGRVSEAVTHARRAQEIDPRPAAGWLLLARALEQADDLVAAHAAAEQALRMHPGSNDLALTLARLDLASGRPADAAARYTQVLAREPASAGAHRGLVHAYSALRDRDRALLHARELVRLQPGAIEDRLLLAEMWLRAERPRDAVGTYRDILADAPDCAPAHAGLGNALLFDEQPAEACVHLERALALAPPTPVVLTSYAIALVELGRTEEARHALREALRLDPGHAPARQLLQP